MQQHVIIVAGGKGTRMENDVPKQFLEVGGKPILAHTMGRFHKYSGDITIVLVLPRNHIPTWNDIRTHYNITIPHIVTEGGPERFHSVSNGLKNIPDEGVVGIHDGVRPLVSLTTIEQCYKTARVHGCAIPVVEVTESLRRVDSGTSTAVKRSEYKTVQTPQCFRVDLIKGAYRQPFDPSFTDDASVAEKDGVPIHLVEGNPENVKITRPIDLVLAEHLLS